MNLQQVLELYQNDSRTAAVCAHIASTQKGILHFPLPDTSILAFFVMAAFKRSPSHHIIVAKDHEAALYIHNDLKSLFPAKDILFFPSSYKNKNDFENESHQALAERTETLNKFFKSNTTGEIIVCYPESIFQPVLQPEVLHQHQLFFAKKVKLDVDEMIEKLVELGFEREDFVYEPGQFSIRGGIIDIFSYTNEHPYRIELFGDEVESIRTFDPETQLSIKKIEQVNIIPTVQHLNETKKTTSFVNAIPTDGTAIWCADIAFIYERLEIYTDKAKEYIPIDKNFTDADAFKEFVKSHSIIEHCLKSFFNAKNKIETKILPQPLFHKKFDLLVESLKSNTEKGFENFIVSNINRQLFRLYSIFEDMQAKVTYHPLELNLSAGFIDADKKIAFYTDHQIFDRYHKFQSRSQYSTSQALGLRELKNLTPGDFITHIDHGVGRFSGLEKLEVNGQVQEMVRLIYSNNDILYVNINSLHKISKYIGKEGTVPKMNKLGSDAWEQLKRKTKNQVKDIAKDLIKLYAKRKARKGHQFPPDGYLQSELEVSFMYEDTPDQEKATVDVKRDMEKSSPMDRLICGDVGFGKTEIAMRAAFKAVCDGKQVAVLVPTTVLAMQHHKSFKSRFEAFPVTIDYMNRFKTTKEKNETLKKVEAGQVDILIGTHSLISDKIKFKDLGLFIIDEEQKFGVSAKEKIKEKKINVDTLTLTATPIPRTLQFSLMGARDLSIINTPPPNRQPVQTVLTTFQLDLIKEAIYEEVSRGGQVFFIHNKVKDIQELAGRIKGVCPDIDIGIAHGQLDGPKLELEMMRFIEKEYDVLIATNIIEAGLDIPNANTIIINNAHHFGMSDLHQLRGRVGRSNKKAYCYLLAPPRSVLPSDSRKRLEAIEQFSELGSGFSISMRDLDIRGAGNILGAEQSGFISDIGFDTYQKIINEAIRELKETDFKDVFEEELLKDKKYVQECQIETDFELWIPDKYVTNINERIALYTELNSITQEEGLVIFAKKMEDRFGKIPSQVFELFDMIRLQWIAKEAGLEKIVLKNNLLIGYFVRNQDSVYYQSDAFQKILNYIQKPPFLAKLEQKPNALLIKIPRIENIHQAREILTQMMLD